MLRRVPSLLERAAAAVASAALGLALAVMVAQIVCRFGLNSSLAWSEELARYALVWSAMVGAAVAYRRGEHIAVTTLAERLSPRTLGFLSGTVHVIVGAFSLFLLYQSAMLTMRTFARHQTSVALQLELGWIYLAVPVGAALMALAALEGLLSRRLIPTEPTAEAVE